jgi:hypothetical protein
MHLPLFSLPFPVVFCPLFSQVSLQLGRFRVLCLTPFLLFFSWCWPFPFLCLVNFQRHLSWDFSSDLSPAVNTAYPFYVLYICVHCPLPPPWPPESGYVWKHVPRLNLASAGGQSSSQTFLLAPTVIKPVYNLFLSSLWALEKYCFFINGVIHILLL